MYDKNNTLTRAGMEQVIRNGGSVLHAGKLYTNASNLPSEAELAKGDEDAENAARENILRQREALDQQLATLGGKSPRRPAPQGAGEQSPPPAAPVTPPAAPAKK